MAKVAIFCTSPEMQEIASRLASEFPSIDVMCVENAQHNLIQRAQELSSQGCDLFLARGLQASTLHGFIEQPIVNIQVSAQDLGLVIMEIKNQLNLKRPRIGIVCSPNMLCSTSNLSELFGVDLHLYPAATRELQSNAADQAINDQMDALIGGSMVCDRASKRGTKYAFLMSRESSLRETFETAKRVCYAIDMGKKKSAEYAAMLDYTFNGIIQVDSSGRILMANRLMEPILHRNPSDVLGNYVFSVFPQMDRHQLEDALLRNQETYASMLEIHNVTYALNIAPMKAENSSEVLAMLIFQEGYRIQNIDRKLRKELAQQGFFARYTFDILPHSSPKSQELIERAKGYSRSSAPILITAPPDAEQYILAQCIHNHSLIHNNSYLSLDCQAYPPQKADAMLFGSSDPNDHSSCMTVLAQDGTLVLSNVECLSQETQYKLHRILNGDLLLNNASSIGSANIRIIACTSTDLPARVTNGLFRSDLYYSLSILDLNILPFSRRREDISAWVELCLNHWQSKHNRSVHLTSSAMSFLTDYDWPGNLYQLNHLCERIVLLALRHNVSETFVRQLLERDQPVITQHKNQTIVYKDKKALLISELLSKHNGNREAVATEMGISKTTLWRYMRKYGIETSFS